MVRTTWTYSLRKEDLVVILEEFFQQTTGTVEELRKRLATFANDLGQDHPAHARLTELEGKYTRVSAPAPRSQSLTNLTVPKRNLDIMFIVSKTLSQPGMSLDVPPGQSNVSHRPQTNISWAKPQPRPEDDNQNHQTMRTTANLLVPERGQLRTDIVTILDKIRKWQVSFNGITEPLIFVERLEELAQVYDICLDTLPRAMPEILRDRALSWYRSNNRRWDTWSGFQRDILKFFLPPRYFEQLEDRIRQRLQLPRETFHEYVLDLQELMRHSSYDHVQQLERIYCNTRQEYQLHIKRQGFNRTYYSWPATTRPFETVSQVLRHKPSHQ